MICLKDGNTCMCARVYIHRNTYVYMDMYTHAHLIPLVFDLQNVNQM